MLGPELNDPESKRQKHDPRASVLVALWARRCSKSQEPMKQEERWLACRVLTSGELRLNRRSNFRSVEVMVDKSKEVLSESEKADVDAINAGDRLRGGMGANLASDPEMSAWLLVERVLESQIGPQLVPLRFSPEMSGRQRKIHQRDVLMRRASKLACLRAVMLAQALGQVSVTALPDTLLWRFRWSELGGQPAAWIGAVLDAISETIGDCAA